MWSRIPNSGEHSDPRIIAMPPADDVAELSLLLPAWQVTAVEAEAHAHGLTAAALLRRLIDEHFGNPKRVEETGARKWA